MSESKLQNRSVVLGVTGSIAAYKAVYLAGRLRRDGASVTVVMTESSQRFVTPLTFQTITRNEVITDLWSSVTSWDAEHVALAKAAECVVVAPATANIIAKAALGIADDALSCLLMTTRAPVIFAPAMNSAMYRSPGVQRNIRTLAEMGVEFAGPGEGLLADGSTGIGRLAEPDEIMEVVAKALE